MEKFRTQLYEESQTLHFVMDSRGGREFSLKRRSGVLARAFDNGWKSHAQETASRDEAARILSWKTMHRLLLAPAQPPADAGGIIEANAFLTDFLQRLDLQEWKLLFRAVADERLIRNAQRREARSSFRHFSVTARFRLRGQAEEIEIGEGSSEEMKFNLDGLARRVDEAIESRRGRRRVAFNNRLPVVLQAGEGGILFHEILGHSLEADYIHQGISPFTPADLDRPIVSDAITILCRDERDPFFRDVAVDDEGEPLPPLLIEKGVLRRFICDFAFQNLLGLKERGHARLEDFSRFPQPRMFAIYVQPGSVPAAEIVASVPYGIYAREFGDGGLDFRSGRFYFHIRQACLIEKGRLTAPVGGLTVGGEVREILGGIGMVGDDFKYDRGVSYCRKNGQVLPVRVGQPTIRIDGLWVGGGDDA
jgi:predicted Zn-dependent protease